MREWNQIMVLPQLFSVHTILRSSSNIPAGNLRVNCSFRTLTLHPETDTSHTWLKPARSCSNKFSTGEGSFILLGAVMNSTASHR